MKTDEELDEMVRDFVEKLRLKNDDYERQHNHRPLVPEEQYHKLYLELWKQLSRYR